MNVLLCLDMTRVTDNKFVYYFGTELDVMSNTYMLVVQNGTEATITSTCTATEYSIGTYQMLLRADSLESENITCELEGLYSYTLDDVGLRICNDSLLDGCSSPYALYYTDRGCNGDASSIANCIYTLEDGSVRYLTTYKNDSTLDVQERFQCHMFETSNTGSTFSSSRSLGSCNATQTSAFNPTEQVIVYTRYDDCVVDTTAVAKTTTIEVTTATSALTTAEFVADNTTPENTDAITEQSALSVTDVASTPSIVTTGGTDTLSPQAVTELITDKNTEPVTDAPTTTFAENVPTTPERVTEKHTEPDTAAPTTTTEASDIETSDTAAPTTTTEASDIETSDTAAPTTTTEASDIETSDTAAPKTTTEASDIETSTDDTSTIKITPPYIPDNKGTTLNAYSGGKIIWSLLVMVLFAVFLEM